MSSAARFLLEFEATGDQEVVAKIREVGAAGKQTATDLQALQGVQDPFAEVATGAESAVAPIQEVGTASAETTGLMTELGTEGTAAATGIEELGTTTEESAGKTMGFADAMGTMTGSIAAIGGSIGSLIGSFTRYNEIQLKVQKAQLTSARATEMSRKAEEGLDKVLATATGNTANIAAAREKLAQAQGEMNKLMDQGVTSGAAFEQAQSNLQAAQKGLSAEFAKGGGDISKLTTAMEKSEINSAKMVTSLNNLELALADQKKGVLDMVFGFSSMAGSIVQTIGSMGKWGGALKTVSGGMKDLISWIGRGGISLAAIGTAAAGAVVALAVLHTAFQVFRVIPKIFDLISGAIEGSKKKVLAATIEILQITKQAQAFSPGAFATGPIMDEAIKKLKEMAKEKKIDISTTEEQKNVYDDFGGTVKQTIADWQNMIGTVTTATAGMQQQGATAADVEKEISAMGIGLTKAGTSAQTMGGEVLDATNSLENLGTSQEETTKALEDGNISWIEGQRIMAAYNVEAKKSSTENGLLTGSLLDLQQTFEGTIQSSAQVEAEINRLGIGMTDFAKSSAAVEVENSKLNIGFKDMGDIVGETVREIEAYSSAVGNLQPVQEEFNQGVIDNIKSMQDRTIMIQRFIGDINQETQAIAQVNLEYEESRLKLADLNTVLDDSGAHHKAVKTAVNEAAAAVLEEKIALEAAAAVASDAGIQIQKVANAYLEGATSIAEWRNELEQTKAAQQGQIDGLAAMGLNFDKLARASAGTLPPTIDNLKLLGAALDGTAEDSQAWLDALSEAFANIQAAGNEMVAGLADAINKGGEDMDDITDKWLEDMPEQFRERLDESQIVAMEGMAELQALAKANKFELEADFKTESLDKARSDFIGNLKEMRSEAEPEFKGIYDEAIKIAEKGTADQMHRVAEILASDDPWPVMLEKLKQIKLEQEGKRLGTDFTKGIVNGVQMGSGAVETELQGMQDQFTTAYGKAKLAEEPIKITADVSQAAQAIGSIQNTLRTMVAAPIKITADVQQAGSAIASIVKTLSTLQAAPIKVTADVSQAHQAIAGLVTKTQSLVVTVTADVSPAHQAIAALVTMKPEPIVVTANTTQAVSSLNAASKAALTMRNNFNAAASGVKSAVAGAGAAVASFSSKASSSFAKVGTAGTQMANKVKSASSSMKSALSSAASSAASFASKCVSSFNKVGSSATSNASKVRNLASAISRLKSKTITITTKYVTSGRPVRGGLQHGGSFVADSPTTIGGMNIGEHYKPELVTVTPLTNPNSLDKTITVNTPRGGGGGSREVVIPVTLMLDNKVLIRTVRRGLVEEVSGAM